MFSVRIDRELRDRFTELAHRHHSTTCQLVSALMKAALKGDELGVVQVGSANPLIVNVNEYFLGRPRSSLRTLLEKIPDVPNRIPMCDRIAWLDLSALAVYCRRITDLVGFLSCEHCPEFDGWAGIYLETEAARGWRGPSKL